MLISPPPPIKLPTGQEVTFHSFLTNSLLTDARFGQDLEHLFIASRIEQAALHNPCQLAQKDYDFLVEVMQKPQSGYNAQIAIHLIPFFQAILEAKKE